MSEMQATGWPGGATRLSRRALLRGAGGAAVAAAALLGGGLATRVDGGAVPRGVSVAGVPLGGLTSAAALAKLNDRTRQYLARPLDVRVAGNLAAAARWQVAPADLGLQFDLAAAVATALAVGRAGGRLDRLAGLIASLSLWGGHDLLLPVTLDDARLDALLGAWAPGVTARPTDATLTREGPLAVVPDQEGRGIDADAARTAILARAAALDTRPVSLMLRPVPAAITAAALEGERDRAAALVSRPPTLRLGDRTWPLGGDAVRAALRFRREGERLAVALDPAPLQPFLRSVADDIAVPNENAHLAQGPDGRYAVTPGRVGRSLDEAATLAALVAALDAGQAEAAAVVRPTSPPIAAADLASTYARLDAILNTPLIVTFAEYARTFGRADLLPLLVITEQPDQAEKVALTLNPDRLRALAQVIATDLDQDARDAQFRWVDGAVRDVVASRDARAVDIAATDQALAAAILGATGTVTPAVAVIPPTVASAAKDTMVVRDRLGAGITDYSFSIPSRRHNVELAVARLDGALVPPDALFSFNAAVGAQTVANGYQEAYGIALVGGTGPGTGQVKTVSSVAGGICQVSTTLFQAVYHAGLPLEERNWHFYWIPGYGPPSSPTGLQGLDATVDDQSGLDFRFRNTTGGWLAVEAVADGASVRIAIYGQDPGWTVRLDSPVITNERRADPTSQIEKTHDLPPGQEVVVEHAVDGFDAINHTVVTARDGTVLRDVAFRSNYGPSRNVTQVGVPTNEPVE